MRLTSLNIEEAEGSYLMDTYVRYAVSKVLGKLRYVRQNRMHSTTHGRIFFVSENGSKRI